MKKLTLLFLLSFAFLVSIAQEVNYSRVRIYTDQQGVMELLSLGIAVDDGEVRPGAYVTCEISEAEVNKVAGAGFRYDVLIEDVARFYEERAAAEMGMLDQLKDADHLLNREWEVPDGFSLGSVGGFCSIDEMLDHLDSMVANYPDLISPVYQFDQLTHEGRPIYWVRISDNPGQNEDEPEVLYTGMNHAREPIGMQHLLFFMYHLLENYDTDPEIQHILNNTELYFVPIINMDGYARNILTNPNGGGQWRKNRRNNGDGTYGVDPNRNYGYAWGWDNSGSSPDPGDATYRGPSAFSEPCTQVMRDFCETQEFRIALNYHSYSNLLLYSWGYIPDFPPDYGILDAYASIMTAENGYTYGPGYTTIYVTNGSSDDWMYGEQETKDKIFAYTPEVGGGSDGFWPSPSRIIPLCQENMWQSMMAAKLAGPYAEAEDLSPSIIENADGYFHHNIQRLGMDETAEYTVYISPVNDAIVSVGDPIVYSGLELLESVDDSISYILKDDIQNGDEIIYVLAVDNGFYTTTQVITKMYGTPVVIFEDDGNSFESWASAKWNTTSEEFYSPGYSITDSPFGNYNNYETNAMVLSAPIDLTHAAYAMLSFWARWEIEDGYDFVQVEASSNGQVWTPLEGKYTDPGTSSQIFGEPVYDGFQLEWVKDELSLEEFIGGPVYFRFVLKSDAYVVEDGFYWDDLQVTIIDITTGMDEPGAQASISIHGPVPNPSSAQTRFTIKSATPAEDLRLSVFNNMGQSIFDAEPTNINEYILSTDTWNHGVYFYRFTTGGTTVKSGKLIVR
jgi:hypothetical protein